MIIRLFRSLFLPLYFGGGGSSGQQNTQFKPPDYAQPYFEDYLSNAAQLTSQPFQQYQGQQIAGMNPDQQTGMDMAYNRAMYGAPDVNAARGMATDTLQGRYLGTNPALQGYTQAIGQGYGVGSDPYSGTNQFISNGGLMGANPYMGQVGNMANGGYLGYDQFGQGGSNAAVSQGQMLNADPYGQGSSINALSRGQMLGADQFAQGGLNAALGQGYGIGADPWAQGGLQRIAGGVSDPYTSQGSSVSQINQGRYLGNDPNVGRGSTAGAIGQGGLIGADPYAAMVAGLAGGQGKGMNPYYSSGSANDLISRGAAMDNPWLSNDYTDKVIGDTTNQMTRAYQTGAGALNDAMAARAGAFGGSGHLEKAAMDTAGLASSVGAMGNQYQLARTNLGAQDARQGVNQMLQAINQGGSAYGQDVNQQLQAAQLGSGAYGQSVGQALQGAGMGSQAYQQGLQQMLQAGQQGSQAQDAQLGRQLQAMGQGSQSYNTGVGQAQQANALGSNSIQNAIAQMLGGNQLGSNSFNQAMGQMGQANALGSNSSNQALQQMLAGAGLGNQAYGQDINAMLQSMGLGMQNYNTQGSQALQAAGMGAQDWQNERANQMNAGNLASNLSQDDYRAAQTMMGVGDIQRQYQQDLLNQQLNMWNQQYMYPQQMLDLFANALKTSSGGITMGSSTTSNPYQASPWANLLGLGAAGYGAYNMMKPT